MSKDQECFGHYMFTSDKCTECSDAATCTHTAELAEEAQIATDTEVAQRHPEHELVLSMPYINKRIQELAIHAKQVDSFIGISIDFTSDSAVHMTLDGFLDICRFEHRTIQRVPKYTEVYDKLKSVVYGVTWFALVKREDVFDVEAFNKEIEEDK